MDYNILTKVDVRLIGLQLLAWVLDPFLNTGVIFVSFQSLEIYPMRKD